MAGEDKKLWDPIAVEDVTSWDPVSLDHLSGFEEVFLQQVVGRTLKGGRTQLLPHSPEHLEHHRGAATWWGILGEDGARGGIYNIQRPLGDLSA